MSLPATAPAVMQEHGRRQVVILTFVMFWMLIFEGSIRKWLAPEYSRYLYFMRDPVALYTYFAAWRAGLFRNPPVFMSLGMLLAGVALLFAVVDLVRGDRQYTVILAVYGLRNYFLYMPLAFLIGRSFGEQDLRRMARHSMVAMIIAAPIAYLQYESPATAPINVGTAADPDAQFDNLQSGSGRVRPGGTFTSVTGMTHLTASTVAWLLWAWTTGRRPRPVKNWLLAAGATATALALAVSGSRTTFIHTGLVVVVCAGATLLLRGAAARARSFLVPLAIGIAFIAAFVTVFPDAYQTFMQRWTAAAVSETQTFQLGWIGRALFGFYDFLRLMNSTPMLGYGVGMAGNGAVNSGVTLFGESVLGIAEEDWTRNVVELGPAVAVLFILYRVSFGIWLGVRSLRATLAANDAMPLLLFTYCAVSLVRGQITGHGLINGFGWLYVGLCLAAIGQSGRGAETQLPADAALASSRSPEPRFANLMR